MKLRNKKTGEIGYLITGKDSHNYLVCNDDWRTCGVYNSLSELNKDWEDDPEDLKGSALDLMILTLTNFIENEPDEDKVDLEDCKQMLEKLKAVKRLEDKGFSFDSWNWKTQCIVYNLDYTDITEEQIEEAEKDLDLLFGGEE